MRKQYGRTMIRWVLASALLWAPAASGAETFVGGTKERVICPGFGSEISYHDITLDMWQGPGTGQLTVAGIGTLEVVTDWMVDGKWGYFSASNQDADLGPVVLYGWIRGAKDEGLDRVARLQQQLPGHGHAAGLALARPSEERGASPKAARPRAPPASWWGRVRRSREVERDSRRRPSDSQRSS